jgi:putative nucleotidyltransferase with HDIG domain
MKYNKESVLAILRRHTVKHTLIYLSILFVALFLIKMDIEGLLHHKMLKDMMLKFQRDMSAFELLVSTRADELDMKARAIIEPYYAAYSNFSGEELTVTPYPDLAMVKVYVYDRHAKQMISDFNHSAHQSVASVFDFYDRRTEGLEMQKKGIPVGVLEEPQMEQLAYGYLMMTRDQRYYMLVTLGLEDILNSFTHSTYLSEEPPYTLIMNEWVINTAIEDDLESIHMLMNQGSETLTYGFNSKTGYAFTQYAKGTAVLDIPFKSPGFIVSMLAVIVFGFALAGYLNYYDLKRTHNQLVTVSQLFDKDSLTVEDIQLDSFDVEEVHHFLSIVKEMLRNIDSLLLQRQEQQELLLTKNDIIQDKRVKMADLHQASLRSSEKLTDSLARLKSKTYQSLKALMYAIEIRDSYTRGHSDRVEFYAEIIASQMNISMVQLENVKLGALLHDVGKIGIRETLLNKSINVTLEDTEEYKMHPHIGCSIVERVAFMDEVKYIVLQHHERMDGTGYPQGLVGEAIHPLSRIVAVADAYDAMTTNRPYRSNPLTRLEAITELQIHSGTQFDKDVVRVFIDYLINEEQKG